MMKSSGCGKVSGYINELKMRREELELSQEALAKRMRYKSKYFINKIEMGITIFRNRKF